MSKQLQRLLTSRGRAFVERELKGYKVFVAQKGNPKKCKTPPWWGRNATALEAFMTYLLDADTDCPTCAGTEMMPCPNCSEDK